MMRIVGGMGEDGNISLSVTSPLVSRYFSNFRGMLTSSKDSPSGLKVEKAGPDTAIVIFPPGEVGMAGPAQGSGMNSVMAIIRRFVVGSLKYRSKKTEFCPILDFSGGEPGEYSFEQLQKDVLAAIKAKRNLTLIDTYQNYLKNQKEMKYIFNQYDVEYGTSEYADVVLLIQLGKLSELQKIYKSKLKLTNWF
jgi:hypothetical protein